MDRKFAVKQPIAQMMTVSAPERMLNADMVEIRVSLTPLRYFDAVEPGRERDLRPVGDTCYATYSIDRYLRIDAKDSRAMFYIVRELLHSMIRTYLGIEL
jgi:hypothetical protein